MQTSLVLRKNRVRTSIFKEVIDSYRVLNSSMFACFLDASKAFDRVNHGLLFRKLMQRGVPGYIIRFLAVWYTQQMMFVRWGNVLSEPFSVSNGVRQGEYCLHICIMFILMNSVII